MSTVPAAASTDAAALAAYVQAPATDPYLATCAAEADAMVATLVEQAPRPVPEVLRTRAALETGAELFYRRTARGGVMSFGEGDGGMITQHVRTDALVPARALLAPYLGPAIA